MRPSARLLQLFLLGMLLGLLATVATIQEWQRAFEIKAVFWGWLGLIGILALLGGSAALAVYASLVRICLQRARLDNLGMGGWLGLVLIASLVGWSLFTVLAEAVSTVVWWLARRRP